MPSRCADVYLYPVQFIKNSCVLKRISVVHLIVKIRSVVDGVVVETVNIFKRTSLLFHSFFSIKNFSHALQAVQNILQRLIFLSLKHSSDRGELRQILCDQILLDFTKLPTVNLWKMEFIFNLNNFTFRMLFYGDKKVNIFNE